MIRLESVVFPTSKLYRYRRMADVLRLSAAENSPSTPLTLHLIENEDRDIIRLARPGCAKTWIENARKAKHQARIVREAENDDVLCMIDADVMVLRPLDELPGEFDIAYTVRPPGSQLKLNTGVYFVRVSNATRCFCDQWELVCRQMLQSAALHDEWREERAFGGIHQAALGYMLSVNSVCKIVELPCAEWNCVDGLWSTAANPRVLHIMGSLRDCCFRQVRPSGPTMQRYVERWRAYDHQAEAARLAG